MPLFPLPFRPMTIYGNNYDLLVMRYACRAGTTNLFFLGTGRGKKESGAWTNVPRFGTAKGMRAMTVPVGSLKPNPWGLYDMSGNVREWRADWHDAQTYAKRDVNLPFAGS